MHTDGAEKNMKKISAVLLVFVVIGGCAKKEQIKEPKTPQQQKQEMSTQPIAKAQTSAVSLEGPYAAVVNYEFAKSRAPISAIEDDIRKAKPAEYPAIEAKLIGVLKNPRTTVAGKQAACRMLERVGGDASVPV